MLISSGDKKQANIFKLLTFVSCRMFQGFTGKTVPIVPARILIVSFEFVLFILEYMYIS